MPLFNRMSQPETTTRRLVAVSPADALARRPRLFGALEMALPVTFQPLGAVPDPAAIVELHSAGASPEGRTNPRRVVPRIVFSDDTSAGGPLEDVRLREGDPVDRRLHGVQLLGQHPASPLQPHGEARDVLAVGRSGARWTLTRGPAEVHRVAGTLPELGPQEVLRVALQSEHSLAIIAIIHFLRNLCAEAAFRPPPLRATMVFDDPNVRWRSYGFIDYRRLVRHADTHDYHAVMAMIPRDAIRAHDATVALFRNRSDRLSLAFHGNSHTKEELLVPTDDVSATSLCAQALRRMAKFESRWGLPIDRVMIPPHGLCSERVAWALATVGFDALCAIHPEPWSQLPPADQLLAGWQPATFAGPLAVIPRFVMPSSQTEIALRAFMGNPVVLYGHHNDLASGLDLLEQAAARVNALGDVQWMSLGAIARSNVAVRAQEDALVVRPYSGRVRVRVPADQRTLIVEEPQNSGGALRGWSIEAGAICDFGVAVPCARAGEIEIRLHPQLEVDPDAVPAPAWRPWTAVRRTAAETRDRVMPLQRLAARLC